MVDIRPSLTPFGPVQYRARSVQGPLIGVPALPEVVPEHGGPGHGPDRGPDLGEDGPAAGGDRAHLEGDGHAFRESGCVHKVEMGQFGLKAGGLLQQQRWGEVHFGAFLQRRRKLT